MTSSGSRVPDPSAAGSRSVRAHLSGCRRSSSHAYACHAGRLVVVVRVVRVWGFRPASYSSVVTVSRWSPLPMRAIWLSHSTSVAASAFYVVGKVGIRGPLSGEGLHESGLVHSGGPGYAACHCA